MIVQDSSGYCYNLELASGIADDKNSSDQALALEYIDSVPEIVTMEKMTKHFAHPAWQMLKTVVYKTESGKYFSIVIRGDLNVNEIKLRKFINKKYNETFEVASETDLEILQTVRGFITPLADSQLKMDSYADESLKSAKNYFGGANASAKSTKNVNLEDLDILEFADFNEPKLGFTSKNVA